MSAVQGLRLRQVAILGLVAGFMGCVGCGESAHYVIRNPDRGVVAIPEDTPELRAKAEKLMHQQFPGGYVIDDVRVVAVGRRHQQRDEVMLYYHAGMPGSAIVPVGMVAAPPYPPTVAPQVGSVAPPTYPPAVAPQVQPAALTAPQGDLPPQPVPVGAR